MDWHFIKKKMHYAWIVCFGSVLVFYCTCGLTINVYSVYQPFLVSEFGFTQTQVGLLNTIRTIANMSSLLLLNKFYGKLKLKSGLMVAAAIDIFGYYVFAVAKTYPVFVLGHFLVGFGYGLACMVPMSVLLERWFIKDRTLAVSICCAASGMATIGVPGLITSSIAKNGLNRTFLIEAVIMTVVVGLGFLIIKEDPHQMHIGAYGEKENAQAAADAGSAQKKLTTKELIPAFVMICLMGAICGPGWSCMSLLASTQGYSASTMALAITLAGAALMVCKFLFGYLCEKITIFKTTMLFFVALILGGILLCISGVGAWALLGGCLIYGGSLAMITVGLISWEGDWVAPGEVNEMKRKGQLLYSIGSLVFTVIPGIVADATGSYVPIYLFFTISTVLCMGIMIYTYGLLKKKNA